MKTTKLTLEEWDKLFMSIQLGDECVVFARCNERGIRDFIKNCVKRAYSRGIDDGIKKNQDDIKRVLGIELKYEPYF